MHSTFALVLQQRFQLSSRENGLVLSWVGVCIALGEFGWGWVGVGVGGRGEGGEGGGAGTNADISLQLVMAQLVAWCSSL